MILHHLSHGAHHVLFAMEYMGIMDYMAHGTAKMGIGSLMKFYSQDKLEYCLTCNTSSNKLKFAIVA